MFSRAWARILRLDASVELVGEPVKYNRRMVERPDVLVCCFIVPAVKIIELRIDALSRECSNSLEHGIRITLRWIIHVRIV